jgi:hypothetical protein
MRVLKKESDSLFEDCCVSVDIIKINELSVGMAIAIVDVRMTQREDRRSGHSREQPF